jgi:hypothetical protein
MRRHPETVQLALTCADGSLAVMSFVTCEYKGDGSVAWSKEASVENINAEIARAQQSFDPGKAPVQRWRPIDPADLPKDRTYRNALVDDGQALVYDLVRAKDIALMHTRAERVALLQKLDGEWMKATGQGDAKAAEAIEAQRQILRDKPAVLEAELSNAVDIRAFPSLPIFAE